jgi:hypothetical protein
MSRKRPTENCKKSARVVEARFAEVEFEPSSRRGMIVELECGVRLLVGEDESVELAAALINCLRELEAGGQR